MKFVQRITPIFVALLLSSLCVFAQGNVRVTLHRPPPNQLKIADLWRVDLVNTTNRTFQVYLHGTVNESTDGLVADATTFSRGFVLPPGFKSVSGNDLQPINVKQSNARYKDALLRTGNVPSGEYRVCVEVLVVGSDSLLGTDCYDQQVDQLSSPILVMPVDESTVQEPLPVFNWLPPAPVRSGDRISYDIKIVQLLGRQTGYDAMQSNPAFFSQKGIARHPLQYPISARHLQEGARYAWGITAYLEQSFGDRIPVGTSEIWTFTYAKPDLGLGTDDTTSTPRNHIITTTGGGTTFIPPAKEKLSPTEIEWRVPKKETFNLQALVPNYNIDKFIDKTVAKPGASKKLLDELIHTCNGDD